MKRLFIGVPVAEEIKAKINPLIEELSASGADVKLVPLGNLHLTLKFLGEVEEEKISEIIQKLSVLSQQSFSISFQAVGVFPSLERINVIWIGIQSPELLSLIKDINAALDYIRKEEREEKPHLTLARMKSAKNKETIQKLVQKYGHASFGAMLIDKFFLYESELKPEGPEYNILKEFQLS